MLLNHLIDRFAEVNQTKLAALNAEEALGEVAQSLERQSRIFDTTLSSITDFVYIFDKDGRFIYSNRPLLDLLGITLEETVGKNFFDLNYPDDLAARLQRQIQQVFDTGETVRDETPFTSPIGVSNYYEYIFSPVIAADGSVELVAGSTRDVTERNRLEANLAFLAEISRDLTRLTSVDEIMQMVGVKIGTFLKLSVCVFVEINEAADEIVINHAWHRADVPDVVGVYQLKEFVTCEFQRAGRAGEIFVVSDTQTDSRTNAKRFAALQIGSFFGVPLIRDEQWRFLLVIYHSTPHDWRADEIELIPELTTRIWMGLERARAEAALRASEERFRAMFEQANVGIVQLSIDGYLLAPNPSFCKIIGYKEEEVRYLTVRDITHPDDYEVEAELTRQLIAGEIPGFSIEKRFFRNDSNIVWGNMTATLVRDSNGKPFYTLSVVEDISERKAAEEAVRQSEERLRLLVESASDYAIFTVTSDNIIDSWNTGAEKVFGYQESEIIGRSGEVLFTCEDRKRNVPHEEIKSAFREGRAEDERWHIRKDGSRFFASGVMRPLRDGKVDGFVKIARDQTERIQAEKALRGKEILQKLVSAQEDERKRIARDLHDHLGQQLTTLRLKLEATRKWCENDEELSAKIDEAQLIARHIDNDVDFLAWELRPAALDDLGLTAALDNYAKEWSRHSGRTAEFYTSGLGKERFAPEVETNLYRIAQEALNNVSKHAHARSANLILEKRGSLITLIVEDDGKGFDVEDKDNRSKGLGLVGMQERAALIGGKIQIESTLNKGTTVFVRIPLEK